MCSACLALLAQPRTQPQAVRHAAWALGAAAGFLMVWIVVYWLGAWLASAPADFFGGPA